MGHPRPPASASLPAFGNRSSHVSPTGCSSAPHSPSACGARQAFTGCNPKWEESMGPGCVHFQPCPLARAMTRDLGLVWFLSMCRCRCTSCSIPNPSDDCYAAACTGNCVVCIGTPTKSSPFLEGNSLHRASIFGSHCPCAIRAHPKGLPCQGCMLTLSPHHLNPTCFSWWKVSWCSNICRILD